MGRNNVKLLGQGGIPAIRAAHRLMQLPRSQPELLLGTIGDGMTAVLILLAISFGAIIPRLLLKRLRD
jgi:hypothetical protein